MRAESPGPQHEWLDDDAGPVVRPYTLTGGRVRSAADGFDLVAYVLAERAADAAAFEARRTLVEQRKVEVKADFDERVGKLKETLHVS